MTKRNFVAKNMNQFNRGGQHENKRQKWIDEQHSRQVDEWDEELVMEDRD